MSICEAVSRLPAPPVVEEQPTGEIQADDPVDKMVKIIIECTKWRNKVYVPEPELLKHVQADVVRRHLREKRDVTVIENH